MFNNIAKENNRIKLVTLSNGVPTCWTSWYEESKCVNVIQADLATALARMIAPGGIDKEIWKEHQGNLSQVLPTENNWKMYQQCEAATAPIRQYIELAQGPHVMVHLELFEGRMAIERMSARIFKMYDNLSADNGACSGDLINRSLNQMVRSSKFILDESDKVNCVKTHIMLESIELCRRIAVRDLCKRLHFHEIDEDSAGVDDDIDIELDLLKGLKDRQKLNIIKIMGAIVHPLFQNKQRMIASGICTDSRYETWRDELSNRMTRHYESNSYSNDVYLLDNNANYKNEWSDDDNDDDILMSQASTKAKEELRQYDKWKKVDFCQR